MQVGATEVEEKKARRKGGDVDDTVVSQRQWGRIKIINMKLQQAKIDLSAKGKHVVSVAQATEVYEGTGDNRKLVGIKPDMHKSVKFDYDTILEFYKEENGEDVRYFAKVKKDRTNVTKVGQIIENSSYDIWKDYFESMYDLETNETYVVTSETDTNRDTKMHRVILNINNPEIFIDHIYHKNNDNRKSQLRLTNNQENCMNGSLRKNNKSGVIGVHWNNKYSEWRATIVDRIMNNRLDDIDLSKTKGIKDYTFNVIKNKVIENFKLAEIVEEFRGLFNLSTVKDIYF